MHVWRFFCFSDFWCLSMNDFLIFWEEWEIPALCSVCFTQLFIFCWSLVLNFWDQTFTLQHSVLTECQVNRWGHLCTPSIQLSGKSTCLDRKDIKTGERKHLVRCASYFVFSHVNKQFASLELPVWIKPWKVILIYSGGKGRNMWPPQYCLVPPVTSSQVPAQAQVQGNFGL